MDYVAAADRLGFYCYHVAEHHATPLNMVPVPGVFLQRRRPRVSGLARSPIVPLYSPLRLIEEIGMFDHLSNGRMEIGVGRGVSIELHNYEPDTAREVYGEALEVLLEGMTSDISATRAGISIITKCRWNCASGSASAHLVPVLQPRR